MNKKTPQDVFEASRPVVHTTNKSRVTGVWRYLESRCIDPNNLPPCVRCIPNVGLVAFALDRVTGDEGDDDVVHAAQVTFLDQDGKKTTPNEKNHIPENGRRTYGKPKGHPVVLPGRQKDDGVPLVCEGLETGLSVWQAHHGQRTVWVMMGVKNLDGLPKPDLAQVRIVADADDEGTKGHADLVRGIHKLHRRGFTVALSKPDGSNGRDANDVLKEQGAEAVRALVNATRLTEPKDIARMAMALGSGTTKPSAAEPPENPNDDRPKVNFTEIAYGEAVDNTLAAFAERKAPVFQSKGRLVHAYRVDRTSDADEPVRRAAGALIMDSVDPLRLLQYMEEHVRFYLLTTEGPKRIPVPGILPAHLLARRDGWDSLRVLAGIVESPTLRHDGSILAEDGYDARTRLLLDKGGVEYPPIPDEPTLEQCQQALADVGDLFKEFPFVDSPSRSVAVSAVLTGIARHLLRNAPVHGFDANSAETGKSTLADTVAIVVTGREAPAMSFTTNEEESEKRWLSILMAGDRVVSIDNVERGTPVGGATFNKVITQLEFTSRLLGKNVQPVVSTAVLVMVNGNNLTFAADCVSRTICARMDAGVERPGTRTFERDIFRYAREHRPKLVAAALTLMRGYVVARRPWSPNVKESRFKEWDRLVRGAIIWAGGADPMTTQENVDAADPVKSDRSALIDALVTGFELNNRVTSQDIVFRALAGGDEDLVNALRPHMGRSGTINTRAVTAYLKQERDIITGGRRVRMQPDKHSVTKFWVEQVREQASLVLEPGTEADRKVREGAGCVR